MPLLDLTGMPLLDLLELTGIPPPDLLELTGIPLLDLLELTGVLLSDLLELTGVPLLELTGIPLPDLLRCLRFILFNISRSLTLCRNSRSRSIMSNPPNISSLLGGANPCSALNPFIIM